jgi:PAS domain S-box-containing protein
VVLVKHEAGLLQLEEATKWLAAIVSSTTDAIITMTCGGVVKSFNPAAERLFGFCAEEIIGLPASVLIPADRQEEWCRALTRIAAGEYIAPYDTIRLDKSGNRIEVFISTFPVRNAGGTIIGAAQIAHGVSSSGRAEKALRESEERLHFALESGNTGFWHLNLIEHTATRSLEHDRIFGYSALLPEWTYEMFLDHVLPQDRARVDEAFRRATNEHSDWSFECRIRRADGEVGWIWAAGRHLVASKGAPPEMVGIVQDITGHKQREEQIRRLAAFDQAALKSLGEGLYTIDCQGLVTFMNPSTEELFGWSFAELRGKKMHDMTHHHYRDGRPFPSSECAGFQVLTHGTPIKNYEDVFIRKDGTFFDVIYTITPLRDDSDTITGLIVVFSDISERKRHEKHVKLLIDEVNHRSKNMLSIVQAIAAQTATASPNDFIRALQRAPARVGR